jgi:hypothetical protein
MKLALCMGFIWPVKPCSLSFTEAYVVLQKVIEDAGWSAGGACATFLVIALCWYALPILLRVSRKRTPVGGRRLKASTRSR